MTVSQIKNLLLPLIRAGLGGWGHERIGGACVELCMERNIMCERLDPEHPVERQSVYLTNSTMPAGILLRLPSRGRDGSVQLDVPKRLSNFRVRVVKLCRDVRTPLSSWGPSAIGVGGLGTLAKGDEG